MEILIYILILEDELLYHSFSGSSFWMFSRRSSSNTALWQIQRSASSIGKSQVLFWCWLFFRWVSSELLLFIWLWVISFIVFIARFDFSAGSLIASYMLSDLCCCHCRTDITGNKFVRKVYKDIVNLHVCRLLTLHWLSNLMLNLANPSSIVQYFSSLPSKLYCVTLTMTIRCMHLSFFFPVIPLLIWFSWLSTWINYGNCTQVFTLFSLMTISISSRNQLKTCHLHVHRRNNHLSWSVFFHLVELKRTLLS
jgi:hypothetical protein